MRLVLHDFGGYAFSAQLARAMAARDHNVLYLYGRAFNTPRGRVTLGSNEPPMLSMAPIDLHDTFRGRASLRRLIQERRYGRILSERVRTFRPDVVISANCPPDAQAHALQAAHAIGAGFVYWWQDRYSDAVEGLLAPRLGWAARPIAARFRRLERRLLEQSDWIVPVAPDFLALLRQWRIPQARVSVIPNWAPLDEVTPLPKRNAWSDRHGLTDRPVFLYAGTLGRKHDPAPLLELAASVPEAAVVVVAEGAGTAKLREAAAKLTNLLVLPMQPVTELPEVLATADVLVAILDADASTFSVPSKVLTYLSAGRPILASVPEANGAAKAIIEAEAGVVVEPGGTREFVQAARRLIGDADLRAAAGRRARDYAERTFGIKAIADRFESVLQAACTATQPRVAAATDTASAPTDPRESSLE